MPYVVSSSFRTDPCYSSYPTWNGVASLHAVVLVGMDAEHVYLNDPEWPDAPIHAPIGDFDLAWLARGERFALLAP